MCVKLPTEHHLESLSLTGGYTGWSETTLIKKPHCWKSHVAAQLSCCYFQMSLTQLSIDSRMTFTQVYARTGGYKGQIVALKMYEKANLYISRKMQKEMKLVNTLE